MDALPLNRLKIETKPNPILSRIVKRIKNNIWSNCLIAERPFKEMKHKLTIENGITCNGDKRVAPQILRREILKGVHDEVHCGITVAQKRPKLQAWWPGYSKDVEEYIKRCPKCVEIKKTSSKKKFTHGPRKHSHGLGSTWIMHISKTGDCS